MERELKINSGKITEYKEVDKNGVPIGIVKGYLATWDIDEGKDQYVKGAFSDHIAEMIERGKKKLQLTDYHGKVIGGIPIASMIEDEKGLFVEGEINLGMENGRDVYSLVKQEVYDSFSTEYSAVEKKYADGIRKISKSKLFGGALLSNPMNNNAIITEVKKLSITEIKNIGISDLTKIFQSANLSHEAARYTASLIIRASSLVDDSCNQANALKDLRDQIKSIREKI